MFKRILFAAALVGLAYGSRLFAGCPGFATPVNYAAGSFPFSIAAGDFNGDTHPDLAVANYGQSVSILLGSANGTFASAIDSTVDIAPVAIAVADFNADGKLDVVVAGGDQFAILIGKGDGTFHPAVDHLTGGSGANALAVGDLNGDGKPDLAIANGLSLTITILLGNGDGTFAPPVAYGGSAWNSNASRILLTDFNGDGHLDLVVRAIELTMFLNNGDGTFGPAVLIKAGTTSPSGVVAGDFNGDGKTDLIVPVSQQNVGTFLAFLKGNGDATFADAVLVAAPAFSFMMAADFNRDGKLDLAAPMGNANTLSILPGWGDGSFAAALDEPVGSAPASAVAGDFNGDGMPDIAVANSQSNDVSVLLNTCSSPSFALAKTHSGSFAQGQSGATYALTVTNADTVPRSGAVVKEVAPAALTVAAMSGSGWTCDFPTTTCTRLDALAAGSSYPPITVTVNVAPDAPATVNNHATLSALNQAMTSDSTAIVQLPDLAITKNHTGAMTWGQTGALFTITVSNAGSAPTSGSVTVTDTVPAGMTATAIAGSGWSCDLGTLACTRADALAAATSYPPITLTVNVSPSAPGTMINTAAVSGGGEVNPVNDTATDSVTLQQFADLSITKTHVGDFTQGGSGTYTLTVHNAGPQVSSGTVLVQDGLPSGLKAAAVSGSGWDCHINIYPPPVECSRSDPLAAGSDYPPILLTVQVGVSLPSSVTNIASVSGGGDLNPANNSASDVTALRIAPRGDFDGDGRADVIWQNTTGGTALWLMNGTSIGKAALLTTVADPAWKIGATGDFDGDRKTDVLWVNEVTGQVVVWLMDGTSLRSAVSVTTLASTNWKTGGAGDVDSDGKSDVFWRNTSTGQTVIWLMAGAAIKSAAFVNGGGNATDPSWNIAAVGDFTGDGKCDVLWQRDGSGETYFWQMNGAGVSRLQNGTLLDDPHFKAIGAGGANPEASIFWWNPVTGEVAIWVMGNAWNYDGRYVTTIGDLNWHPEAVGDFDGDGHPDLFWRNIATGDTVVWLMNDEVILQAVHVTQVNGLGWTAVDPR